MILDTCALLWLAEGGGRLSAPAKKGIEAAAAVYVSAITGFEVGLKQLQGKLRLSSPAATWLPAILDHHSIDVLPIDLAISIRATELPPHHRDPCDRLIIATALLTGMAVVTADPRFAPYGIEIVW